MDSDSDCAPSLPCSPNHSSNDLSTNNLESNDKKIKRRKTGVIYIQSVPPLFTATKMREILSSFGEVARIYLQAEKHISKGGKRHKRYVEGWVEFKSKRDAKSIAKRLNGTSVGGKRRSAAYDALWTMKYLSGFKWVHLMEQLDYERRIEEQRLRTEVSRAKRSAEYFAQQVEKGEKLRRLEEKVLKKGGLWEKYQLQTQQRSVINETKKHVNASINKSKSFLKMIFDADDKDTE